MQVDEILSKVRCVMDPNTGKRPAVLIDYAVWEEFLTLLEGMEGTEGNNRGQESNDQPLRPFGLCAGEFTVPDDFDDPLPPPVPTKSGA